MLIGLQLPVVIDALGDISTPTLLGYAALICLTVIVVRFAWVFAVLHAPKKIVRRMSSWRGAVFLSWAGMRGAVSLAAALALPLETDTGAPFPGRDLILFLTFSVILATLVGQGLTLPLLIRVLGLEEDGGDEREDAKARIRGAEAAIARLEELEAEDWVRDDTAERMRGLYRFRTDRFTARFDESDDGAIESRSQDYQHLRRELLEAERNAILELSAKWRDLERRLDPGLPRPRPRGSAPRRLSSLRRSSALSRLRRRRSSTNRTRRSYSGDSGTS